MNMRQRITELLDKYEEKENPSKLLEHFGKQTYLDDYHAVA